MKEGFIHQTAIFSEAREVVFIFLSLHINADSQVYPRHAESAADKPSMRVDYPFFVGPLVLREMGISGIIRYTNLNSGESGEQSIYILC